MHPNTHCLQEQAVGLHTHTHKRWLMAIPEGKQWIEKGSERCFWLPSEPQSSGLRAQAPPGPQGGGGTGKEGPGRGSNARRGGMGRGGREGLTLTEVNRTYEHKHIYLYIYRQQSNCCTMRFHSGLRSNPCLQNLNHSGGQISSSVLIIS